MPVYLPHLFLIEGGALGIENALKASFDWKVRKNYARGYTGERGMQVLHFKQAFHGRTGYTMSLTNTDPIKTEAYPKFSWPRIENPKITFPLDGRNLENVIEAEKLAVTQIERAFEMNRDDIAAMIIEPIQAEGGDHHFRPEFFKELRGLADRHSLCCYDEASGWGFRKIGPSSLRDKPTGCVARKLQCGGSCL